MKKVLVIGDSCKDVFQYGKCERLNPEAPIPIFKQTKSLSSGGMAYNVYSNLKALGVECDIVTNSGMPLKTRYVDEVSNQMLLRIDENDDVDNIDKNLLKSIRLNEYSTIVISDYNKGFLSTQDIEYISTIHPLVFMDTKKKIGEWVEDVDFIKINEKEYLANVDASFMVNYRNHLIVTEGKNGARWIHSDGYNKFSKLFPIETEHPVRDLSGAGDTFLAALVADYIINDDISSAIKFANKCAAWVVTQKGVVVVDLNKIMI